MTSKCNGLLIVLAFITSLSVAAAKDAGDLLWQYLDKPNEVATEEVLILVEVVSIEIDEPSERGWKKTGTLYLKRIEALGGDIPETFSVRFHKRYAEGNDAWTWDYTVLNKGNRLLGFFHKFEGKWAVRPDGRTNVINNPGNIDPQLLERAQLLFKTPLLPEKRTGKQNNWTHQTTLIAGASMALCSCVICFCIHGMLSKSGQ